MCRAFLILILLAVIQVPAFAVGALYARRALSNDNYTPLRLKSYDAAVTDQMAVTHIDHTFKNESSSRLEGIFIFPLRQRRHRDGTRIVDQRAAGGR